MFQVNILNLPTVVGDDSDPHNPEENRIAGTQGSTFKTFAAWRKIMKQCSYLIQELVLFITNLT
jgi:hypothetical protein